jgi:hypothetical protein
MKFNINKTKVISFYKKTNVITYDYKFCQICTTRTNSIKSLRVFLDSKLYFSFGLVRSATFISSSLDCLYMYIYINLHTSKLEYISDVWNSTMSTDADKLQCIHGEFSAFSVLIVSFPHMSYLLKFTLVLKSVPSFWKLLVSELILYL